MSILDAIQSRRDELNGRRCSRKEVRSLRRLTASMPVWLAAAMSEFRLAGTSFVLPNPDPQTVGFGEAMTWLSPREMVLECQPHHYDRTLPDAGYFPIGQGWRRSARGDRVGLGDPFCVRCSAREEPALFSISHETGPDQANDLLVVRRLSALIRSASIVHADETSRRTGPQRRKG